MLETSGIECVLPNLTKSNQTLRVRALDARFLNPVYAPLLRIREFA
jgi:hypothetical protein